MIIKLAFAFGAGFISFFTPCVLPIIPGYISYITGKNLNEIEAKWKSDKTFEPKLHKKEVKYLYNLWLKAVKGTLAVKNES